MKKTSLKTSTTKYSISTEIKKKFKIKIFIKKERKLWIPTNTTLMPT